MYLQGQKTTKGANHMEDKTKLMIPTENRQKAEEVMQFYSELSEDEQRELLNFIRGARFAKSLQQKTA